MKKGQLMTAIEVRNLKPNDYFWLELYNEDGFLAHDDIDQIWDEWQNDKWEMACVTKGYYTIEVPHEFANERQMENVVQHGTWRASFYHLVK